MKWATGRSPVLYQGYGADWRLTTTERKRILLNNIHGVDIDSQAVEVTKLSLLLKVLEGENEETLNRQFKLFHERALPDLSSNIKCGNSLIGPDFYKDQQMNLLNEEEHYRINVFDWGAEFPEIMKSSHFDAVIGNPPYVRQETLGEFKGYFQQHYKVYHSVADLYVYFIEKSMSLLKEKGLFGFIVANKWMRANYGNPLRDWMNERCIEEIIDFGDLPVFQGATTYPCILRLSKQKPKTIFLATKVENLNFINLNEYVQVNQYQVNQQSLDDKGWSLVNESTQNLVRKLFTSGITLGNYVNGKIFRGILTGLNKAFVIDEETKNHLIKEDSKSEKLIKPFLLGREIKRYEPLKPDNYLILIPRGWTNQQAKSEPNKWKWLEETYPVIAKHLQNFVKKAEKRYDKGDYWWELRACDYYDEFKNPKIMLPDISIRGNFTLDDKGEFYCVNTAYIISSSDKYLLGILNSSLITFIYKNISSSYRGGYLRFIYQYLVELPIRIINFYDPIDKARHNRMVELVERMLLLHKQVATAKTSHDKTAIQRQIDTTDQQIDRLVYELYGLTEEEIKIVDETMTKNDRP